MTIVEDLRLCYNGKTAFVGTVPLRCITSYLYLHKLERL